MSRSEEVFCIKAMAKAEEEMLRGVSRRGEALYSMGPQREDSRRGEVKRRWEGGGPGQTKPGGPFKGNWFIQFELRPYGLPSARLLCPWGFSRQECWSGLPCLRPGDFPDPGIRPRSPALQVDSLLAKPPRKPSFILRRM